MTKVTSFSLTIITFVLLGMASVFGMDCETPPFIVQAVEPNVLIIFDDSGSMANAIWIDGYDRSIDHSEWRLPAEGDQVIFAKGRVGCAIDNGRVSYSSWRRKVKLKYKRATPGSTDICSGWFYRTQWSDTDGYFYFDREEGEFIDNGDFEPGNPNHIKIFLPYAAYSVDPGSDTGSYTTWYDYDYLNWLFYESTQADRVTLKQQHDDPDQRALLTRILVAKKVVRDLVETTEDVRFGFMKFNGSDGGKLEAEVSADKQSVLDAVDAVWASGLTPLAEALEDTWDYFSDKDEGPIQYRCQKNFVILITDGYPTSDADDLGSLKGDWDNDHGGSEKDIYPSNGSDYLDDIAYYIYLNDSRSDLEGKQNICTYTIGFTVVNPLLKDAAFNGNGLAGLQDEWDNPQSPLYHRYFYTAYSCTELREALSHAINDIINRISSGTGVAILSNSSLGATHLFRAKFHPEYWRGFLEAFSVPYDDGDVPLWDAGLRLKENTNPDERNIFTALDSESGSDRKIDHKVNFVPANIDIQDADGVKLKTLLGAPNDRTARGIIRFIRGEDFPPETRTRGGYRLGDIIYSTPAVDGDTVYVGANDGLLHAFDATTGMEKWAFVPNNLLSKLKDLCLTDYCHEYFVDLSPVIADVTINGVPKKVLIAGERAGGKAYFCLDITDPDADSVQPMWEFTDPDLGESWSVPDIKPKKLDGEVRWLAFFGSGIENADSKGWGFAVDIATGQLIRKGKIDPHSNNAITAPRTIDIDRDGCVDIGYVGSLQREMIRADLGDLPTEWKKKHIFMTRPRQPITIPTSLCYYDDDPSHVMVFFGTGKLYDLEDKTDFTVQSFYAVKDEGGHNAVGIGQLVDQTTPCNPVPGSGGKRMGWYIDFSSNPGERVISSALAMGGYVFFPTFQPSDDPCSAGGIARLWVAEYDTGCAPESPVVDINGDEIVDDADMVAGEVPRTITIGCGLPSDIILNPSEGTIIIQTSDSTIHQFKVKLPGKRLTVHSWREVID